MRRVPAVVLLMLAAAAAPARAQSNTAEQLQRAIRLYEDLEVDRALVILNQVISPSSPFVVSPEQQMLAYKYIGAALALQQGRVKRDSAVVYFRAAIERDPFTDLDPQSFSPGQLTIFQEARQQTFKLGLRSVPIDTIDPRTGHFRFRVLSTHAAHIRLEIRTAGVARRVVYDGDHEGLRELEWDGLADDGRLLPGGRYQLVVVGESRRVTVPRPVRDTALVYFQLDWVHEALEDTLAEPAAQDLRPERYPSSAATADLLKGVGVAAAALVTQTALTSTELGSNKAAASVVAIGGVAAGVTAFFHRQGHRVIPANVAANARLRADRAATNAAIQGRNNAKLAETRLAVAPAAGAGL